jgi:D-arabinose 1-dehydrogenase-like Zn-dependent alcohol dehydrogenase
MQIDCAGHEGAGVVAAIGEDIDPEEWKVGDRAGLKPIYDTCHTCDLCREGKETYCDKAMFTGTVVNGTYAQVRENPERILLCCLLMCICLFSTLLARLAIRLESPTA